MRPPFLASGLLLLLLVSTLAGCLDASGPDGDDAAVVRLDGPVLRDGQVFDVFLRTGTGTLFEFGAAAVRTDDGRQVAPDEPLIAAFEAAFDVFPLGGFSDAFVDARADGEFPLYRFPMQDGTSWETPATAEAPYLFVVRYDEAIETLAGPERGFVITVSNDDGAVEFRYDLLLASGWMSRFARYEGDAGQESELYRYDFVATDDAITEVIVHETSSYHGLSHALRIDPAAPTLDPDPAATFDVVDADHVFVWVTSSVSGGAQDIRVTDPQGNVYQAQAVGLGATADSGSVLAPAVPGTWHVTAAGAATHAQANAFVWQLDERRLTVPY